MFAQARLIKSLVITAVALCLSILFQVSAHADTLTITGSSNSQNPLLLSSGQIGFLGTAFNNNFNVTAVGQTFSFVFGQFQIGPAGGLPGDSGCTDGPCVPITLTGTLTTPVGALSFGGVFEETLGLSHELTVDWLTGSGPFVFATPQGGSVTFTLELLDFFGSNSSTTQALLLDQTVRVTITAFQPGGQTAVPEPATMVMLAAGLGGLFVAKRKRR